MSDEYKTILTEREDSTFIITLNRPDKLNALNLELGAEVVDALLSVKGDPNVRSIIIWGGTKAFAAGADLNTMSSASTIEIYNRHNNSNMWDEMAAMPIPTIAAVAGFALGGGCELAMACDFRIAADNAKFGQPEINVGIIPGAGGTQRLPRLVGATKAKEMIFLGDMINAEEAYRIGLVNKIVPVDSLLTEAKTWAKKLASKPPFSLQMAKAAVDKGLDLSLDAGMQIEHLAFASIFATEDQREGVNAFLEKRKPQFKGK